MSLVGTGGRVCAGLDLGGTASRIIIWRDGACLASSSFLTRLFDEGNPEEKVGRLADMITSLLPNDAELVAVGIGASGPMDIGHGIIQNPYTLPALSGFPIVAMLERRLKCRVAIENDAVVAALAEHRLGAGRGARRMVMVTLGTGIGVALLLDSVPFRTVNGAHPEASHIPITSGTVRCYCGIVGCWEQTTSRAALQAQLLPLLPATTMPDRVLVDASLAASSDPAISSVFTTYGGLLGRGLCTLCGLYAPDVIVLGGSAAAYFPLFREGLETELGRTSVDCRVTTALLGESGAIGAALVAGDLVSPLPHSG